MKPAMKKLQINVDESEESKKTPSPKKTGRQSSRNVFREPSPKVIKKQTNDQEIFITDTPDVDFD